MHEVDLRRRSGAVDGMGRMTEEIRVNTGKSEITLDELGTLQPGMPQLMAEIAPRIGTCYHAAVAENWGLARYMLLSAVKIMRSATILRPKYRGAMTAFVKRYCDAVQKAIDGKDIAEFREAFDSMTEAANAYHRQYGHPYIHWRVPPVGPMDLDLTHRE
jgi:hypothetical protein